MARDAVKGFGSLRRASVPADLIIDTGTPTGGDNWGLGKDSNGETQFGGGLFHLDQTYVLTEGQGYMQRTSDDTAKSLVANFYYNDPTTNLPGVEIREYSITVPYQSIFGWYGYSGNLGLNLGPGDCWLTLETDSSTESFWGHMRATVPTPLPDYAWNDYWGGPWSGWISHRSGLPDGLGFRIYGDPAPAPVPVPVPGAALLGILGSAFTGWGLRRQRP